MRQTLKVVRTSNAWSSIGSHGFVSILFNQFESNDCALARAS